MDEAPRERHLRESLEKYPLRPDDADMADEYARAKSGQPQRVRAAVEGLRAMQSRIAMLKADKTKTLEAMDDAGGALLATLTADLNRLNKDLAEAEIRLTEYQAQQGLN